MKLRIAFGTLLVLLCVAFAALLLAPVRDGSVTLDPHAPLTEQNQFWIGHITKHGPAESYTAFANWVADFPEPLQHSLAHVIGGALYEVAGTDGLFACTSDYSYGCYHEFLGQAVHQEGLEVVESISASCRDVLKSQALGCQHGIGHGVTGYLGYDLSGLKESLDVCERSGEGEAVTGCAGGVFMEFNTQTLLADDGETRPYEPALGPYYPCTELPSSWQPSCYFWQTQWWQMVAHADYSRYEERAALMGAWCAGVTDKVSRLECFRGIGYNAPGELGYDSTATAAACEILPSHEGTVECLAGAAGSLLANPASAAVGYTVCDSLDTSEREYCVRTATMPH